MNTILFPTLANMFGPQGLMIFSILLLLFGAKKLPELARGMGLAIKEFSKAKNDIQDEILRDPPAQPPQAPKQIDAEVAKTEAPAGTKAQNETHV
jgi:sec-independent protein translocase protein TatA